MDSFFIVLLIALITSCTRCQHVIVCFCVFCVWGCGCVCGVWLCGGCGVCVCGGCGWGVCGGCGGVCVCVFVLLLTKINYISITSSIFFMYDQSSLDYLDETYFNVIIKHSFVFISFAQLRGEADFAYVF